MLKHRLVLLLFAALVSGAAQAGLFDDDEARKQIADIKTQVEANQKAFDDRMATFDATMKDRILDLSQVIDGLKQDLTKLRGQIEVLANQADTIERKQKELYVDLDTRMRKLDQAFQEKVAAPEREAQKEKESYEAALNQFKVGNFQASIAAFQTFVVNYPNSSLLPSAQYWIGNAYYATRDFKMAIATQQKVVASWPDNPKASDALLNIASAQAELGEQKAARETLRALIQKYPSSPAAEQAKQRIKR